jgi:hypothetical protein
MHCMRIAPEKKGGQPGPNQNAGNGREGRA